MFSTALTYFMKLKIRVFVKILMLESETKDILLIGFDFTYLEICNFLTLTQRYGKINQETCAKL